MDLNRIETKFNKDELSKEDIHQLINHAFNLTEQIYNLQNELEDVKKCKDVSCEICDYKTLYKLQHKIELINIEDYKELLTPFMDDLESRLNGVQREFDFDFAIKNLVKRYENQKLNLQSWHEKYPNEF